MVDAWLLYRAMSDSHDLKMPYSSKSFKHESLVRRDAFPKVSIVVPLDFFLSGTLIY